MSQGLTERRSQPGNDPRKKFQAKDMADSVGLTGCKNRERASSMSRVSKLQG